MYGDFQRWYEETGLLYDQAIGNFYQWLTELDKDFLAGQKISPFGDNRSPRKDL